METQPFSKFLNIACISVGGMVGCLIAIPLTFSSNGSSKFVVLLASIALGMLVGYRRRGSRVFLYFCLLCVLILSSLVSFSFYRPMG